MNYAEEDSCSELHMTERNNSGISRYIYIYHQASIAEGTCTTVKKAFICSYSSPNRLKCAAKLLLHTCYENTETHKKPQITTTPIRRLTVPQNPSLYLDFHPFPCRATTTTYCGSDSDFDSGSDSGLDEILFRVNAITAEYSPLSKLRRNSEPRISCGNNDDHIRGTQNWCTTHEIAAMSKQIGYYLQHSAGTSGLWHAPRHHYEPYTIHDLLMATVAQHEDKASKSPQIKVKTVFLNEQLHLQTEHSAAKHVKRLSALRGLTTA